MQHPYKPTVTYHNNPFVVFSTAPHTVTKHPALTPSTSNKTSSALLQEEERMQQCEDPDDGTNYLLLFL